jgi:hypothetical protein
MCRLCAAISSTLRSDSACQAVARFLGLSRRAEGQDRIPRQQRPELAEVHGSQSTSNRRQGVGSMAVCNGRAMLVNETIAWPGADQCGIPRGGRAPVSDSCAAPPTPLCIALPKRPTAHYGWQKGATGSDLFRCQGKTTEGQSRQSL